jgi:hypothetical protein
MNRVQALRLGPATLRQALDGMWFAWLNAKRGGHIPGFVSQRA